MKQDDYFLNQIDILGRILGKVLADLLMLKNQGNILDGIEIAQQQLISELDLDLNEIILLSPEKLIPFLNKKFNFKVENLDKIAEILFKIGVKIKSENTNNTNNYLTSALTIFNYTNTKSSTFSIEKMNKIEKIKSILK
jgi:hypothetical protein